MNARTSLPLALLACLAPLAPRATADTVHLVPDRDNTMYEENDGLSNALGEGIFIGSNGGGWNRRALVRFDVAAAIPPGSTIHAVTLECVVSQTSSGPQTVTVHRALADWGEGTSLAGGMGGGGGTATNGDATWSHTFYPNHFWATPGGDMNNAASASAVADALGTTTTWNDAGLVADVQAWVDAHDTNFGWVLRNADETTASTSKRFSSRENGNVAERPRLTVDFTPPANCTATNYCTAPPNSTLSPALISVSGSCSVADAALTLSAGPVPNETFLFFHGAHQVQVPFGDGFLCVSGGIVRIGPPMTASGNLATRTIDPAAYSLHGGTTRNFQCWFRDPAHGGAGFGTSDGIEVVLLP